jgi:hypothetical protein
LRVTSDSADSCEYHRRGSPSEQYERTSRSLLFIWVWGGNASSIAREERSPEEPASGVFNVARVRRIDTR